MQKDQVEDVTKDMLHKVIIRETRRANGSVRIQEDYSCCPTMAEQHTAHVTDINYLIKKFKPDELAAYLAARQQHRQEILGHDFSQEPNLQEAKNEVLRLRKNFEALPEEIKNSFSNHVEFLKFIDNPANQEKMIKMGLLTKKEIKKVIPNDKTNDELNDDSNNEPKNPKNPKDPK